MFHALLTALGVSAANGYDMNSLAVPRKVRAVTLWQALCALAGRCTPWQAFAPWQALSFGISGLHRALPIAGGPMSGARSASLPAGCRARCAGVSGKTTSMQSCSRCTADLPAPSASMRKKARPPSLSRVHARPRSRSAFVNPLAAYPHSNTPTPHAAPGQGVDRRHRAPGPCRRLTHDGESGQSHSLRYHCI